MQPPFVTTVHVIDSCFHFCLVLVNSLFTEHVTVLSANRYVSLPYWLSLYAWFATRAQTITNILRMGLMMCSMDDCNMELLQPSKILAFKCFKIISYYTNICRTTLYAVTVALLLNFVKLLWDELSDTVFISKFTNKIQVNFHLDI